jgi:hypothetical protein
VNVIDCRPEKLAQIRARLRAARTLTAAIRLLNEGNALEAQVEQSMAEVNRLAHGWTYAAPPPLAK